MSAATQAIEPIVVPAEADELQKASNELVARIEKEMPVTNQLQYDAADQERARIASIEKGVTQAFADAKSKAYAAHKAICKIETDILAGYRKSDAILAERMKTYYLAQESIRREAESRERARVLKEEEDRRLAEAQALSDAREPEEAEKVLAAPIVPRVIELPKVTAKNTQPRKSWTWDLDDATKVNDKFKVPDRKKIDQVVASMGPDAAEIVGGITVREDVTLARVSR